MARPIKSGVDYFPHDTDSASRKTLFTLESKFGNDGYAFWFKLLEILGTQEGLYYDCGNPAGWLFLVAKTRVDEVTATEILNILSQIGAIDAELWECKIVWIQNFVDRLKPLYDKRVAKIPDKPSYRSENPVASDVIGEISTQSKVKKSKGDIPPLTPPGGNAETKNENEEVESLTVKTAGGTGIEKPVDHSTTPIQKRFNDFWSAYPKKKSKGDAERAWKKLKPTQELLEKMLNAIEAAKKSEQWQKDGGQFIPYPGSWLRDKGWEDEYTVDVDESGTSSFDTDEFFEAAVERSRAE